MFGAEPDIDIKPSSLEPSCEKLSEPLSGDEPDFEELVEGKPLSKDIDTKPRSYKNLVSFLKLNRKIKILGKLIW